MTLNVKPSPTRRWLIPSLFLGILSFGTAGHADDIGKKACMGDAKLLCSHELHLLSRSRVQACLIKNIDKTSAFCHSTMLKLKAEHLAEATPAKN
jgi:hypothetical protein